MTPIGYHQAAEDELLNEVGYLELRVRGLGRRFYAEVRRAEKLIAQFPEAAQEISPGIRKQNSAEVPILAHLFNRKEGVAHPSGCSPQPSASLLGPPRRARPRVNGKLAPETHITGDCRGRVRCIGHRRDTAQSRPVIGGPREGSFGRWKPWVSRVVREREHISMIRENPDGTNTPLTLPNHHTLRASTLRTICTQAGISRDDFLAAHERS